jgi:tripartite ATP-independent transporter DctP family solute receptor
MPHTGSSVVGRRAFLAGLGAATVGAGCRGRLGSGPLVLRVSHSMTAGPTSLHVFAETFARRAEEATNGAVRVRLFTSNTLGQEREVVQQLQEGLVDFMVSGSAIWGSVAPRLQLLDFPFVWSDWDHVHRVVDGPLGHEVADYLAGSVRMRPLAFFDSFGFRHVVTRSRDILTPADLANLKIRTIQSSIYVKTIELMGASPTPMAFGEVYTSLQTGVIDGFEHDASTTLQQRFYEVATVMTRTHHIAGVLGLWASTLTLERLPPDLRAAIQQAAIGAALEQRSRGPQEEAAALTTLRAQGMTIREFDNSVFRQRAEQLWASEARSLDVAPWLRTILS